MHDQSCMNFKLVLLRWKALKMLANNKFHLFIVLINWSWNTNEIKRGILFLNIKHNDNFLWTYNMFIFQINMKLEKQWFFLIYTYFRLCSPVLCSLKKLHIKYIGEKHLTFNSLSLFPTGKLYYDKYILFWLIWFFKKTT